MSTAQADLQLEVVNTLLFPSSIRFSLNIKKKHQMTFPCLISMLSEKLPFFAIDLLYIGSQLESEKCYNASQLSSFTPLALKLMRFFSQKCQKLIEMSRPWGERGTAVAVSSFVNHCQVQKQSKIKKQRILSLCRCLFVMYLGNVACKMQLFVKCIGGKQTKPLY